MPKKTVETSKDLVNAMGEFYGAALKSPDKLVTAYTNFLQDALASLTGKGTITPERGDKRFMDPIWASNPVYKALMENYLSWSRNIDGYVDSLELDNRTKLRAKLLSSMMTDTMAPTNMILGNPQAMKATLETGGKNLIDGAKNLIDDAINNNGLPSMVDMSAFDVGKNLGLSEGQVIYREEHMELIQYKPQTEKVYKRPIFIIPPQINKFYVWDLAPRRSVIEYLLAQGHQIFIVAWRNPGKEHADWDMNSYVMALDRATEVTCEISKSKDLNFIGACSGGITAALLLAYWSAKGIKRANSYTMLVSILDTDGADETTMGLFANMETLELARLFSRSKGVLSGKDLQKAFAWLRPNDLIWSYWVNNYLLGKKPPAFDVLYWNADTTNLTAAFHGDLINMLERGGMKEGNTWPMEGYDLELKSVTCDKFIVAGTTDHITPWDGCYKSMHSFGGENEFVLSKSGHIQSIINPPGNPKSRYSTNTGKHSTPEEYLQDAEQHEGTWWDYWSVWLAERSGTQIKTPKSLGSQKHQPICAAPGTYVFDTV